MPTPFTHETVLKDAVVSTLTRDVSATSAVTFVDGTLGGGGHSEALLSNTPDSVSVVGIDRDPAAISAATSRLSKFGRRFRAVRGTYADHLETAKFEGPIVGIVLDLGVSSPQLDQGERGFSFQHDGPVDMRMDPTVGQSAADLIANTEESELTSILRELGEEPRAYRIAKAIKRGTPWTSTVQLATTIAKASGYRNSRTHPATRTFQALRMAVNDELGQLDRGLNASLSALAPGGRIAIISFHSLEDRAVKKRFRLWAGVGTPRDAFGHPITPPMGRMLTKKGIAGADEDPNNPRARSARLRVFEKDGSSAHRRADRRRPTGRTEHTTADTELRSHP